MKEGGFFMPCNGLFPPLRGSEWGGDAYRGLRPNGLHPRLFSFRTYGAFLLGFSAIISV